MGADIGKHVGENIAQSYGDRIYPTALFQLLNDAKRLGEKTGSGFYKFDNKRRASPDPELAPILQASRKVGPCSLVCCKPKKSSTSSPCVLSHLGEILANIDKLGCVPGTLVPVWGRGEVGGGGIRCFKVGPCPLASWHAFFPPLCESLQLGWSSGSVSASMGI